MPWLSLNLFVNSKCIVYMNRCSSSGDIRLDPERDEVTVGFDIFDNKNDIEDGDKVIQEAIKIPAEHHADTYALFDKILFHRFGVPLRNDDSEDE